MTDSGWLTRAWQLDDGLPNSFVTGLARSQDGFLLIGSSSGVARFDGFRFESFSLTNISKAPDLAVTTVLQGRNGALWLGLVRGGIVRLDGKSARVYTQGLPEYPRAMAEDAGGGLWISYRGGALYRLKDEKITLYRAQAGLPKEAGNFALATDNQGRLWFAGEGHVGVFLGDHFKTLRALSDFPMRLSAAQDGGVWVSCGLQLYKCDSEGGLKDFGAIQPANSGTSVTCLLEDSEGAVWLGTSFSGLYRHDQSGFAQVLAAQKPITSLLEADEGSLWVGAYGGGLNRIRHREISIEGIESGLPYPSLLSICEAADGSLWAATENGVLARRVNGRWSEVPMPPDWQGEATCVTADRQGTVWIQSSSRIFWWSEGRFNRFNNPATNNKKFQKALLAGKTGDVWLSQRTPPALLRLHAGQVKSFVLPATNLTIRALTEDAAGNIWAGSSDGKLFRLTGALVMDMTSHLAHEPASIRCLSATADGTVWIGYASRGVGCFKDGRFTEFGVQQGLYDNHISQIVSDNQGWMWFGANRGIFKVREQDFLYCIAGRASRVRSVSYGHGDGLPSTQANFGSSPNVLSSHDGRLWFPMQTGLAVVDPAGLNQESGSPPQAIVTLVKADDRTTAQYRGIFSSRESTERIVDLGTAGAEIRLPAGYHRMEIDFTALNLRTPENIQFRYRLKGLDDEWEEAGAQRSTTYLRLPGGKYVFEVSARNGEGDWNSAATALSLAVSPFFWQAWWFRASGLAAFTLSIIITVRYVSFRRLRKKLRALEQQASLQKERSRIAKDIHDDLGAGLTQIAYLGELAHLNRDEPGKVEERIQKMSSTAREAVKSLDEIVWAVNPRNDTLAHLIDYTNQFAFSYLSLTGARIRLDFPEQIPARELATDLRHNIFLALKEALHNIVKHAGATEVWLRARVTEQALELSVEDNGCGFACAPDDALADGLRNMRQRMSDIGGECRVESRPGRGTKVVLHLPWANPNK